jgi:hypothetical protein
MCYYYFFSIIIISGHANDRIEERPENIFGENLSDNLGGELYQKR